MKYRLQFGIPFCPAFPFLYQKTKNKISGFPETRRLGFETTHSGQLFVVLSQIVLCSSLLFRQKTALKGSLFFDEVVTHLSVNKITRYAGLPNCIEIRTAVDRMLTLCEDEILKRSFNNQR
jgi:hypothetical protein